MRTQCTAPAVLTAIRCRVHRRSRCNAHGHRHAPNPGTWPPAPRARCNPDRGTPADVLARRHSGRCGFEDPRGGTDCGRRPALADKSPSRPRQGRPDTPVRPSRTACALCTAAKARFTSAGCTPRSPAFGAPDHMYRAALFQFALPARQRFSLAGANGPLLRSPSVRCNSKTSPIPARPAAPCVPEKRRSPHQITAA